MDGQYGTVAVEGLDKLEADLEDAEAELREVAAYPGIRRLLESVFDSDLAAIASDFALTAAANPPPIVFKHSRRLNRIPTSLRPPT